jgi:hypothetical protein
LGTGSAPHCCLVGDALKGGGNIRDPGRLLRLVGFELGDLTRQAPLRFERLIGVLQPQEIAFRQAEKSAQPQIGIRGYVASAIDDRVDPVARDANRMSELVC